MLQKGKEREKKRRKFRKGCPNLRRLTGQHSQVEKKKSRGEKNQRLANNILLAWWWWVEMLWWASLTLRDSKSPPSSLHLETRLAGEQQGDWRKEKLRRFTIKKKLPYRWDLTTTTSHPVISYLLDMVCCQLPLLPAPPAPYNPQNRRRIFLQHLFYLACLMVWWVSKWVAWRIQISSSLQLPLHIPPLPLIISGYLILGLSRRVPPYPEPDGAVGGGGGNPFLQTSGGQIPIS